MRIPVIAPRLKIIQKYFDENMLMFYDPGNYEQIAGCIERLFQDRNLRRNLVLESQVFIRQYSWKSQERKYLSLIDDYK
jgi:glycosyltransferase involved in cell wall biosynthesis